MNCSLVALRALRFGLLYFHVVMQSLRSAACFLVFIPIWYRYIGVRLGMCKLRASSASVAILINPKVHVLSVVIIMSRKTYVESLRGPQLAGFGRCQLGLLV